jgi:hypothetical protein
MPSEVVPGLKQGSLPFPQEAVFRATGEVLEHEPFLSWDFTQQDPKTGLVEASAPSDRVVQIQLQASAPSGGDSSTQLSLAVPKKPIKGEKSVWISRADSLVVSAYDIEFSKREPWRDVTAAFQLDRDYLVSAIYRQLTDRSAVPFSLEALGQGGDKKP